MEQERLVKTELANRMGTYDTSRFTSDIEEAVVLARHYGIGLGQLLRAVIEEWDAHDRP